MHKGRNRRWVPLVYSEELTCEQALRDAVAAGHSVPESLLAG